MKHRHCGTILLIVAGLAAILATMTLAFILRMRSDGEESEAFAREVQARLMLTAGLNYIQETARLGWTQETFGWWDPRDGRAGPKDIDGNPAKDPISGMPLFTTSDDPAADGHGPVFPGIGGKAARCPMYRMSRPPWAIRNLVATNPVPLDPGKTWAELISANKPNPQPVADTWDDFARGDATPVVNGSSSCWFRIFRAKRATFVITCGSGHSRGFRDWPEAVAAGEADVFGSAAEFSAICSQETIYWYEAEWNAAVGSNDTKHYKYYDGGNFELADIGTATGYQGEKNNSRQFGGTFTYIQRLAEPPAQW